MSARQASANGTFRYSEIGVVRRVEWFRAAIVSGRDPSTREPIFAVGLMGSLTLSYSL